jgi:hypothetical protein
MASRYFVLVSLDIFGDFFRGVLVQEPNRAFGYGASGCRRSRRTSLAGKPFILFGFDRIDIVPTRVVVLGVEGVFDPVDGPIFRGFIVDLREGAPQASLRALCREVLF